MLVSQSDYASMKGVSAAAVHAWRQRGLLKMEGSKVDVEASDTLLAQRSPYLRRDRPRAGETPVETAERVVFDEGRVFPDIQAAQLYKESALAVLRRVESDVAVNEVSKVSDMMADLAVEYGALRNALLSLPAKVAPRLVLQRDPNVIKDLLEREIVEALEVLGTRTKRES